MYEEFLILVLKNFTNRNKISNLKEINIAEGKVINQEEKDTQIKKTPNEGRKKENDLVE